MEGVEQVGETDMIELERGAEMAAGKSEQNGRQDGRNSPWAQGMAEDHGAPRHICCEVDMVVRRANEGGERRVSSRRSEGGIGR